MGGKDTLFRDRPDSQRYRSRWNKSQLQYLFCKHRFGKKTTTMRLGRSTYGVLSATAVAAAIASVALIGSSIFVVESFAPTLVVVGRSSLNNNNNNVRLLLSGGIPSSNFLHPLLSSSSSSTQLYASTKTKLKPVAATVVKGSNKMGKKQIILSKKGTGASVVELVTDNASDSELSQEKKIELVLLAIWGISISAFIIINNAYGPWPLFMKTVPERMYFLSHMVGGMLFGGGIILTTCIERLVAKSNNPGVLQFWFDKVPALDGLIVVPALTISMISGTGLSIVRYGGLNIAPPHVGAIFWTLIAFMSWWAATDLTTQGTALKAVERMYEQSLAGEEGLETPKVVVDRHFSNVVSCFFILTLYSMMVLKPGTLIHPIDRLSAFFN